MPVRRRRIRISGFITTIQCILFLVHLLLYETFVFFWPGLNGRQIVWLGIATLGLSVSFVAASLLAYRRWKVWVRMFYRIAAVWLGIVNFFFLAACASWMACAIAWLAKAPVTRPQIAELAFGIATAAAVYGLLTARWVRVKRMMVRLPNLPASWRGRVAAVISDIHLGHVNGPGFLRRIVRKMAKLKPDVVFVPGDLYDGTHVDLDEVVGPWKEIAPPLGIYFVTGNHEEFSDRNQYVQAVSRAGLRVLNNEKVTLDYLQIVGVHDSDAADRERFRSLLELAHVDSRRASILLTHVPRSLRVPEEAGISLQISGHTHGGQIFPFTWFTRRIFGPYTHGLQRFGDLQVYTTYGAGTWGPPMRVGTRPEIVLMEFV